MAKNVIQFASQFQPDGPGAFFCLPGEIRTKIYQLALFSWPPDPVSCRSKQEHTTPTTYAIRDTPRSLFTTKSEQATMQSPFAGLIVSRATPLRPSHNALALTCRQAYAESAHIFYEDNFFCIWSGAILGAWMQSVPDVHIKVIEQLTIKKALFHRPGSAGFKCHRLAQLGSKSGYRLHLVYDHKFMGEKQLRRLEALTNLKHLRFVGRLFPPKEGRPAHPPLKLFRRLLQLTARLERLEGITIVSLMHRKYNTQYEAGRLTAARELRKRGWGYELGFHGLNRVIVDDHIIEILWKLEEGEMAPGRYYQ